MTPWIVRHDEALLEAKRTLAEAIHEYGPNHSRSSSTSPTRKSSSWQAYSRAGTPVTPFEPEAAADEVEENATSEIREDEYEPKNPTAMTNEDEELDFLVAKHVVAVSRLGHLVMEGFRGSRKPRRLMEGPRLS